MPPPHPAVLFDWDGTLLNSGPPTTAAWQAVLDEFGCAVPETVVQSLFLLGWPYAYLRLRKFGELPSQQVVLARLANARRTVTPARLFDDAAPALLRLRQRGVAIGLVTNSTTERLAAEMAAVGVDSSWFDVQVTGDAVARPKPAPDPYLRALRDLHPRTAAVAVEDSVVGMTSATAAGLLALLISRSGEPVDGHPPMLRALEPDQLVDRAINHYQRTS